jgi:hypothetical protein
MQICNESASTAALAATSNRWQNIKAPIDLETYWVIGEHVATAIIQEHLSIGDLLKLTHQK